MENKSDYSGKPTIDQKGLAINVFRITWPSGIQEIAYGKWNIHRTIRKRKIQQKSETCHLP